eukprot:ctg_578.g257
MFVRAPSRLPDSALVDGDDGLGVRGVLATISDGCCSGSSSGGGMCCARHCEKESRVEVNRLRVGARHGRALDAHFESRMTLRWPRLRAAGAANDALGQRCHRRAASAPADTGLLLATSPLPQSTIHKPKPRVMDSSALRYAREGDPRVRLLPGASGERLAAGCRCEIQRERRRGGDRREVPWVLQRSRWAGCGWSVASLGWMGRIVLADGGGIVIRRSPDNLDGP